jgi:hypothetical protein
VVYLLIILLYMCISDRKEQYINNWVKSQMAIARVMYCHLVIKRTGRHDNKIYPKEIMANYFHYIMNQPEMNICLNSIIAPSLGAGCHLNHMIYHRTVTSPEKVIVICITNVNQWMINNCQCQQTPSSCMI